MPTIAAAVIRSRRTIAGGTLGLAFSQNALAHDAANILIAWGALLFVPVPPLWAMLGHVEGLKVSFLLWCGAFLLYEYGSLIPPPFDLHATRGLYSIVLMLAPYPVWLIHRLLRAVRGGQRV